MITIVHAKSLTREPSAAESTAKPGDGVGAALDGKEALANEEARGWIAMLGACLVRATRRNKHGRSRPAGADEGLCREGLIATRWVAGNSDDLGMGRAQGTQAVQFLSLVCVAAVANDRGPRTPIKGQATCGPIPVNSCRRPRRGTDKSDGSDGSSLSMGLPIAGSKAYAVRSTPDQSWLGSTPATNSATASRKIGPRSAAFFSPTPLSARNASGVSGFTPAIRTSVRSLKRM